MDMDVCGCCDAGCGCCDDGDGDGDGCCILMNVMNGMEWKFV